MKTRATTLLSLIAFCALSHTGIAADIAWTGGANDGNKWSTPGNWEGGAVPTESDVAHFTFAEPTTIDVDQDIKVSRISIAEESQPITFDGAGSIALYFTHNTAGYSNSSILNLNRTSTATTFNCGIICHSTGKFSLAPGLVINGPFSIGSSCNYIAFVPSPPPAEGLDTTIIRGKFAAANATVYLNVPGYSKAATSPNRVTVDSGSNLFEVKSVTCQYTDAEISFKSGRIVLGNAKQAGFMLDPAKSGIKFSIDGADVSVPAGPYEHQATNGFRFNSGSLTYGKLNNTTVFTNDSYLIASGFTNGVLGAGRTLTILPGYTLFNGISTYDKLAIDGSLFVTNVDQSLSLNSAAFEHPILSGSGSVYARTLKIANSPLTVSTKLYLNGNISMPKDGSHITLENATIGTWGDVRYDDKKSATFNLAGAVTFDTADNLSTGDKHAIYLNKVAALGSLELNVVGGGTVDLVAANNDSMAFKALTVGESTALSIRSASSITIERLTLGRNSKLILDNAYIKASTATIGDGAHLEVPLTGQSALSSIAFEQEGAFNIKASIPSTINDAIYSLVDCPNINLEHTSIEIVDATGKAYTATEIGGKIYLAPGNITPDGTTTEWTGTIDGKWSNAANWTRMPTQGDALYFNGTKNTASSNDLDAASTFSLLSFKETAGPFVLSGNGLSLTPAADAPLVISSQGHLPVVISNDISITKIPAEIRTTTQAPITLAGNFSSADGTYREHLGILGTVRFASDAEIPKLKFLGVNAVLNVTDGATVTITHQENLSAQTFSHGHFEVDKGGTLRIAAESTGGFRYNNNAPIAHRIDGTLAVDSFLSCAHDMTFSGEGLLLVAENKVYNNSSVTLTIADSLTFCPTNFGWYTARESAPQAVLKLAVDSATLAAASDWTFGPECDSSLLSSSAAERSLIAHGTLTIDTANIYDATAQTITFKDPIIATEATVIKKGLGSAVLPETGCDFSGGIVLSAGSLVVSAPIECGFIKFEGGGLAVNDTLRRSITREWTTIATCTSVEGTPSDVSRRALELRVIESQDSFLVQARKPNTGLTVVVY